MATQTDNDNSKQAASDSHYEVLARKYRPQDFRTLIGQSALVQTLTNAIEQDRIAHAYILTGVRGVGKTTTARIIARALNCIGADGNGAATAQPCGLCDHCLAIAQSRHVDVLEMDAATRTGVDDIRELLDGVRYRPVHARNKIYIIDEVHMLSTSAFNALLKTLEEPPPQVRFIFATTEIRKVPATILSRCQRFDLRRIDSETLIAHFKMILEAEKLTAEEDALRLIARAAEGSVRDGLSLLDQGLAHGQGHLQAEDARTMLGLADRSRVIDLFTHMMKGEAAEALRLLHEQYEMGADPVVILRDLLELSHWLTRLKVTQQADADATVTQDEQQRGRALAEQMRMAALSRVWQMLLKGIEECQHAPSTLAAVEMILIRICYAAELPPPAELVRRLSQPPDQQDQQERQDQKDQQKRQDQQQRQDQQRSMQTHQQPHQESPPSEAAATQATASTGTAQPASFADIVALAEHHREGLLCSELRLYVRPIKFEPGRLTVRLEPEADARLAPELAGKLAKWTGHPWVVVNDREADAGQTMAEQQAEQAAATRASLSAHPLVKAVMDEFPGAEISRWQQRSETDNPSEDNGKNNPVEIVEGIEQEQSS